MGLECRTGARIFLELSSASISTEKSVFSEVGGLCPRMARVENNLSFTKMKEGRKKK
jgi:hypothetical protein